MGYLSSGPSGFRSLGCKHLIVFTLQFILLELACSWLIVQVRSATNISITWGNTLSATIYLCFSCYFLLTLSATIYLLFLIVIVHLLFSKDFQLQKVFSKIFVGLLESASLWVVILARVRLPTFGSPQTPCKRDYTERLLLLLLLGEWCWLKRQEFHPILGL